MMSTLLLSSTRTPRMHPRPSPRPLPSSSITTCKLYHHLLLFFFLLVAPPPCFIPTTFFFVSAGMKKTNPCPEVPTLICQHGSFCTPGHANFGPEHAHLQLQTSESGYYCDCSNSNGGLFIGHECQIPVDKCIDGGGWSAGLGGSTGQDRGVPYCYHGAQCRVRAGNYTCDCHELNQHSSPTAVKYAGSSCQHPSTSFCVPSLAGNGAPNFQFCTNDGTCRRWVEDGEAHPGCSCLDGYAGGRCEIGMNDPYANMAEYNSGERSGGASAAARTAGIVLLVLGLVVLIPVVACLAVRARRKKRRNDLITNTTTFAGGNTAGTTFTVDGKTVVGEGDLDADGSGTLGSSIIQDENNDDINMREHNGHDAHRDENYDDDDLKMEEVDDTQEDDANGEASNGNAAPLSEIV